MNFWSRPLHPTRSVLALAAIASLMGCAATAVLARSPAVADMPAPRLVATAVGRIAVHDVGQGPLTLELWPSILANHGIHAEQIAAWRSRYRL